MSIRSTKYYERPRLTMAIRKDAVVGRPGWAQFSDGLGCANTNNPVASRLAAVATALSGQANHPVLRTARFDLMPLGRKDASLIADLGSDPDVVKTLICDWSSPARRLAIARSWIDRNQEFGIWGVFDRGGVFGNPGGFIGFCAADEPLEHGGEGPETYYAFAKRVWGRGVATEAVDTVIRHLFEAQGVKAVEALVLPGLNLASRHLAENLGMVQVGRYPHGSYAGDQVMPTIRFETWRVRTASPQHALRNLEEAAFKIGQFVAADIEVAANVAAGLHEAASFNGLITRLGKGTVDDIINESLVAGMKEHGWLHYRIRRPGPTRT